MKQERRREILDLCDICGKTRVLEKAKDKKGEIIYICKKCKGDMENGKI